RHSGRDGGGRGCEAPSGSPARAPAVRPRRILARISASKALQPRAERAAGAWLRASARSAARTARNCSSAAWQRGQRRTCQRAWQRGQKGSSPPASRASVGASEWVCRRDMLIHVLLSGQIAGRAAGVRGLGAGCQVAAEFDAGVGDVGTHRGLAAIQHGGDFLGGQILDIAQQQGQALALGQAVQPSLEAAGALGAQELLLGVELGRSAQGLGEVVERNGGRAAVAPQEVDGGVGGDAREPVAGLGEVAELVAALQRLDARFLGQVLGILDAADDVVDEQEDALEVQAQELLFGRAPDGGGTAGLDFKRLVHDVECLYHCDAAGHDVSYIQTHSASKTCKSGGAALWSNCRVWRAVAGPAKDFYHERVGLDLNY